MEPPIACSLDSGGALAQLEEWRNLLDAVVTTVERRAPTELRMQLDADQNSIGAVIALAQREVACCPFFAFTLQVDAHGMTLTTTVPPDAAPVVEAFAQLVPR
jgi:hypothetical protein